jgi:hypothetical protein
MPGSDPRTWSPYPIVPQPPPVPPVPYYNYYSVDPTVPAWQRNYSRTMAPYYQSMYGTSSVGAYNLFD